MPLGGLNLIECVRHTEAVLKQKRIDRWMVIDPTECKDVLHIMLNCRNPVGRRTSAWVANAKELRSDTVGEFEPSQGKVFISVSYLCFLFV